MKDKAVRTSMLIVLIVMSLISTSTRASNQSAKDVAQDKQEGQAPAKEVGLPAAVRPNVDTLALIRRQGKLRVGVSLFVPWVMRDKNGELIGFEIDVAKKLAEDMGVDIEFDPVPFKEVINDLLDERFDIIISGLYVTPQRALFINFCDPHGTSEVTLLASRKTAPTSHTPEAFDKAGVKLGAVAGTVYADLAKSNFPKATLQIFSEEGDMLKELLAGNLQAVIVTSPVPEIAVHLNSDKVFVPFSSPIAEFGESFAIRKGDVDFLNYLNVWTRFYKENGWLKGRRHHWFKSMKWADDL